VVADIAATISDTPPSRLMPRRQRVVGRVQRSHLSGGAIAYDRPPEPRYRAHDYWSSFASLPTLIPMKEKANRPQDRANIEQLRARMDNDANK
jgi:hypothetical protein